MNSLAKNVARSRHDPGGAPSDERAGRSATASSRAVAYIMSRFPLLTETFILREMLEMERQGASLEVFPLLRAEPSVRHEELGRLRATVHYTPFLSGAIVAANVHYLRRSPRRYLKLFWSVIKGNWGSANLFVGALGIFPKSVYFARLVEERGIPHVHAHYATHPALSALIISELTGAGYSFTAHAHDIFMHQRMLPEKMDRARFVAAISGHNKNYLLDLAPRVPAGKIEVVHCGIELEKYDADRDCPADDADKHRITAICVASLQPYKGIRHLIRACAEVTRREPGFRCLVVGEGFERAELEALIDELGLRDAVCLLGGRPQHEVAQLLREADLFVLPSVVAPSGQMDGIPVALMEAMASRLPVVSTRLSGIPELVEHDRNGLLVEPGDETALAQAIMTLAGDPDMRRRMGERGHEKVAAEFQLDGCVAALRELIEDAAADVSDHSLSAGNEIGGGADKIEREVAEWASAELARDSGEPAGPVHFERLGGGADSEVFEVRRAGRHGRQGGLILKVHRPNAAGRGDASDHGRAEAENEFVALSYLWSVFLPRASRLAVDRSRVRAVPHIRRLEAVAGLVGRPFGQGRARRDAR